MVWGWVVVGECSLESVDCSEEFRSPKSRSTSRAHVGKGVNGRGRVWQAYGHIHGGRRSNRTCMSPGYYTPGTCMFEDPVNHICRENGAAHMLSERWDTDMYVPEFNRPRTCKFDCIWLIPMGGSHPRGGGRVKSSSEQSAFASTSSKLGFYSILHHDGRTRYGWCVSEACFLYVSYVKCSQRSAAHIQQAAGHTTGLQCSQNLNTLPLHPG